MKGHILLSPSHADRSSLSRSHMLEQTTAGDSRFSAGPLADRYRMPRQRVMLLKRGATITVPRTTFAPFSNSCPRIPGTLLATIDGEDVSTSYNDVHVDLNFACPMKRDQRGLWRTAVGLEASLPSYAGPPGFHNPDWLRRSPYPELVIICVVLVSVVAITTKNISARRRT
jgi:hypothetical protein